MCVRICLFFFFKQKTAYEMRISDWSSDVCSSDLLTASLADKVKEVRVTGRLVDSPACVVVDENELSPHLLRMLQAAGQAAPEVKQIGRASCRERVCQYV